MVTNSKKATQDFVPIKDIKGSVVQLKSGQYCMVLLASSINFALKSADEQKAILTTFQNFLNTLDFSLQFYTQSRRLNIRPYLELLEERSVLQNNDLMRIQLREYINFIQSFTAEVDVMSKNFFVVIPYIPTQINLQSNFKSFMGTNQSSAGNKEKGRFEEYRTQLEQRAMIVEQGLNRIGIRTIPLQEEELVEMYYHIFNPSDVSGHAPQRE